METKENPIANLERYVNALGIQDLKNLLILDTDQLNDVSVDGVLIGPRLIPQFPPNMNVFFFNIQSIEGVKKIEQLLSHIYPASQKLKVLVETQAGGMATEEKTIHEIEDSQLESTPSGLFLPARQDESSFETFEQVVARLRAPDGCPWDREQTHLSLRPHLLEETYETLEAIDRRKPEDLKEELGDLLLQIVLNAQIAFEAGEFSMGDVIEGINRKIVHRHPHVFKDVRLKGVDGVLKNWEKIKEAERVEQGVESEKGMLDGAPKSLPALSLAQEYQDRAARVGFDWPSIEPVLAKVHEELAEVQNAKNDEELSDELGDLLFAVVNLVRWKKMDGESALRGTNRKFAQRFKYIEQQARKSNRKLSQMTLEEMDRFWEEAKSLE